MSRRTMAGVLGAAVLCALTLFAVSASAAGFEYVIKNQKSQIGSDGPALVLQAADIIKGGTVTIKSSSAPNQRAKLEEMRPGAQQVIPLKAPRGEHTYEVTIEARGLDGVATIPLQFKVLRVKPVQIQVEREGVDTGRGVIPFKVNRPLDRVEMEFADPDGKKIGARSQSYGGKSGALEATWEGGVELGSIRLKAYDVDGFWTSVLLEPWWIEIDHEEIIFDFGKATWQGEETPKLKKSLGEIREAMRKYAKHRPDMRLYIAGYTDTVGSASQNQKLSEQRARAIAQWFRKSGLDIPVYYQGFGESALKVKTPDETKEARNRRALYVLGNAPPPQSHDIPRANWKRAR